MKKSKFTDSQIMQALKRVETGMPVPEHCREVGMSIRLACQVFDISASCYRYEALLDGQTQQIADWLVRLTDNDRSWGFGLCYLYLRNVKGFKWNHKRLYRIYRELELNLRIKPRKRLVRDKPEALSVPLGIEIDLSLPSERVIRALKQVIEWRGKPGTIRCDNGPEYISAAIQAWAASQGIALEYIQPGNPQQNAYVERFNRTVRYEWLSQYHWLIWMKFGHSPPSGCGNTITIAPTWLWEALPQSGIWPWLRNRSTSRSGGKWGVTSGYVGMPMC
jgi:putative transposase